MTKRLLGRFAFAALASFISSGRADLLLGTPFRDGAVLQREKPVAVWGRASPSESVTVQFHGQSATVAADNNGAWQAMLGPFPASAAPAELVVRGHQTVIVRDVVVGDVWLCSGQSNMFFYVRQTDHAAEEIAQANYPLIRQFLVKSVVSESPQDFVDGEWQSSTPQTVATFTAVGYFFARELQRELQVPIGIIRATLGGSPIEAWLSHRVLAADPAFAVVAQRWEVMRPTAQGNAMRNEPSGLYNGLIHPLEPYALTGFLWYQGEGNHRYPTEYGRLFRTMITQWREDFRQPDAPFLFVQLPEYDEPGDKTHESWAWLREGQASALTLPHTGMAVTLELGDPKEHHPTNKQEVGRRLALVALRQVYRRPVVDSGPVVSGVSREGAALRVTFSNADGLRFAGDSSQCFLVAGPDRRFVPAQARIEGSSVIVSSSKVPEPMATRFEWSNTPAAYLKNSTDLPAAPFRTDSWPDGLTDRIAP